MQDDSSRIANYGVQSTDNHASHEEPGLPSKSEVRVYYCRQYEQNHKGDVGCEAGQISVHCELNGADVKSAVGVGSVEDGIRRHAWEPEWTNRHVLEVHGWEVVVFKIRRSR